MNTSNTSSSMAGGEGRGRPAAPSLTMMALSAAFQTSHQARKRRSRTSSFKTMMPAVRASRLVLASRVLCTLASTSGLRPASGVPLAPISVCLRPLTYRAAPSRRVCPVAPRAMATDAATVEAPTTANNPLITVREEPLASIAQWQCLLQHFSCRWCCCRQAAAAACTGAFDRKLTGRERASCPPEFCFPSGSNAPLPSLFCCMPAD